jgi:hypothetical protein
MKKIDFTIVQKIKEIIFQKDIFNYKFFFEKMIRDKKEQLLKVKLINIYIYLNNPINLIKYY